MSDKVEIKLNGEPASIESGWTVESLLMHIAENKTGNNVSGNSPRTFGAVAVELNGEIVPRDQFGATQLNQNDAVEVVTLVGGG